MAGAASDFMNVGAEPLTAIGIAVAVGFARSEALTTEPTNSGLDITAPLRFGASNNADNARHRYLTA